MEASLQQPLDDDLPLYSVDSVPRYISELITLKKRIANVLIENGGDIETVEIEAEFAKHINLAKPKNHISNVLEFSATTKYERAIVDWS